MNATSVLSHESAGSFPNGSRPPTILVVDDEPSLRRLLAYRLGRAGYQVEAAESGEAALTLLDGLTPDLVLLDLKLPGMQGLEVLEKMHEAHSSLPILVLTALGSVQNAVLAMKLGARDFLTKPLEIQRLEVAVKNALELEHLSREVQELRFRLSDRPDSARCEIVGRQSGLRETFLLVEKVLATDLTVLLHGESGTGKELVARAIHGEGPRRMHAFLAVSCAALPEALLESELFGYERGAFTGADKGHAGHFEAAGGGTLLLDEIAEMSVPLQAKLLRTLQEGTVTRLGSTEPRPIDVRIICATNRDLEEEVRSGRFREDLFYRLSVFPVRIPPLRERRQDIPSLCRHVLDLARPADATGIHPSSMQMLEAYHWPGNVRELQNVIRRAIVLAGSGSILPEHLAAPLHMTHADHVAPIPSGAVPLAPFDRSAAHAMEQLSDRLPTLEELERVHVMKALQHCRGNLSRTARTLGIGRTTLYRKLHRYGVQH